MSTTLHPDSDVNSSESFLTEQKHGFQKLREQTIIHSVTPGLPPSAPRGHCLSPPGCWPLLPGLTLYWRVAGSTVSRGLPFTLIRPFPLLQWATAVAVFYDTNISIRSQLTLKCTMYLYVTSPHTHTCVEHTGFNEWESSSTWDLTGSGPRDI